MVESSVVSYGLGSGGASLEVFVLVENARSVVRFWGCRMLEVASKNPSS